MKRVLILCLHRPNRSPSQRFRFEQYLPYLRAHGFHFDFSYLLDSSDDKIYYSKGNLLGKARIVVASALKRFSQMLSVQRFDLIFVQREGFMLGTDFFERRMAAQVPMIFDFDDSIWLDNVSAANSRFSFLKDGRKTARLIESAAQVFAGNQFLADYAATYNSAIEIIPTTIDTDEYFVSTRNLDRQPLCIGWSGSFSTIEHFSTALPALARIRQKYGNRVRFKIVGDGNYQCPELGIQGQPWRAESEISDFQEMDIGIMPLPYSEWAQGKCALKGLQYMAFGIPTVMTPIGVNAELIQDGVNGFLAADEEQWVDVLSDLIEDASLRRQVGLAGRKTVEDQYSVDAWKDKYLEIFRRLTT